jgi:putative addiction module component (TIGR02574 family)
MDPESRAQLAARLIQSLDAKQIKGIDEKAVEQLWLDEAERRLARIDAGKDELVPAEQVLEGLRNRRR